jgi:hypothetical protein
MSGRSNQIAQIIGKGAVIIGALFVVTVVLAAIPSHNAPTVPMVSGGAAQQEAGSTQDPKTDHGTMAGMDMADDEKSQEHDAVSAMTGGHDQNHDLHMYMTTVRQQTPEDVKRAKEIVEQLRAGIEKYKDYHVALNEGYRIFLPKFPQPEYHFTSYKNGFLEAFTFDPSRPTSLLYKKTLSGYQLVGAMYTMPKHATEDQLNARVPLSVAMWHLHTNLCMPAKSELRSADWSKFGLRGSIATQEACDGAGGKFSPVIFGWMVHVYPYEDSLDKIFAMHHHE